MFENEEKVQLVESGGTANESCDDAADIPCGGECSVTTTIGLIGGKWKILILWQLRNRVRRFGELHRMIPAANKRMLTQQLRELEHDGLVHRKVYAQVPPKVEYSLTATGNSLQPVIDEIGEWGKGYMQKKNEAA